MRRVVSSWILTLALVALSASLTSHVITVAALGDGRPSKVLHAMIETEAGKSLAAGAISAQLQTLSPKMTPARADTLANRVVRDPGFAQMLDDSGTNPVSPTVLATISRIDPKAGAVLAKSKAPVAEYSFIPRLDQVGGARALARQITWSTFAAFGILAGLSLLMGPYRSRMLVRVAKWAVAASIIQVLVCLIAPAALGHIPGRVPIVLAAGLHAAGIEMGLTFGVILAGGLVLGVIGWLTGYLSPVSAHRDNPVSIRREAARRGRDRRNDARSGSRGIPSIPHDDF